MSTAVALHNGERAANYIRQNIRTKRSPYLTPAQERRLRKHDNRAKGDTQDAPMGEFVEVEAYDSTVLEVIAPAEGWDEQPPADETMFFVDEIPTASQMRPCGGTEYCITKSGNKASKTHKGCE